ncbi:MAG: hypothetical protein B6D56_08085 [Candidatus Omnitrophica bacterium 4484_70.1]|nr:MAG: hypothetical protein B6D56_08085 [Candidatus Omnitrophica bacterium 4484_70.1]
MEISVIIPAYNEEKRILPTLEKVYDYFSRVQNMDFEIIVVDDGSKDNTEKVVKNFAKDKSKRVKFIKHKENKGKGTAVKTGMMEAKGEYILFSDADLSTPIEEFGKLKKAIDRGYDIAIGSRGLPESKIVIPQPWYRRYIGKIFPLIVRIIVMKNFRDTQCGFKLFKKKIAKELFANLVTSGFAFDVEILYKALKKEYNVKEIPVKWYNYKESKVSILKAPFNMLKEIIKIKRKVK